MAQCFAQYCKNDEENFPPMVKNTKVLKADMTEKVESPKSSEKMKTKDKSEGIKRGLITNPEKSSSVLSFNRFSVLSLDASGDEPDNDCKNVCNNSIKNSTNSISESKFDPNPLRGGGKNEKNVFVKTIDIAKKHGISLNADLPNPGQGDCLFDSIVDNVNHRDCFQQNLEDSVDCYRELWVTELEEMYKSKEVFPGYGGKIISDDSLSEWTAAWMQQKNPGEYNVDQFNVSDLTPLGLGHCVNKNILVFSTDANEPVKVFPANYFDKQIQPDNDIPVVIAYDSQNLHYESLLPQSEDDNVKCSRLVSSVLNMTYDKDKPKAYLKKSDAEKKASKKEADHKRQENKSQSEKAENAKRMRESRANELPDAKKARLDNVKVSMNEHRNSESADARQARLDQDKKSKTENRNSESADARQARLDQKKVYMACKRNNYCENMFKLGEYENIQPFSVGKMNKICVACGAYMFAGETHKGSLGETSEPGTATFSLCCSYGKVKLAPLQEMPPLLKSLLLNDDSESKDFRKNIRDYNNALTFSSRGFSGKPFQFSSKGPQIFKVSGQMYHCMGNVLLYYRA